jgi:hypothetical protein
MSGACIALFASGCGDTGSPPPKSERQNVPTVSTEPAKKIKGKPVLKNKQVRGFSLPTESE